MDRVVNVLSYYEALKVEIMDEFWGVPPRVYGYLVILVIDLTG